MNRSMAMTRSPRAASCQLACPDRARPDDHDIRVQDRHYALTPWCTSYLMGPVACWASRHAVVDVLAVASGQRRGDGEPEGALAVGLPRGAQEQGGIRPLAAEAVGQVKLVGEKKTRIPASRSARTTWREISDPPARWSPRTTG